MSYQNILVPVDGSDISFSAIKYAAALAKAFNSKLTAISIVADDPFAASDFYYSTDMLKEYIDEAIKNANEALDQAEDIAKQSGVQIERQVVRDYVSAESITKTAESLKTDLIVMGSHGRKGFQKFLLGSLAQDVLGKTTLPVFVVKQ